MPDRMGRPGMISVMAGKKGRSAWGYIRPLPSGRFQASYIGVDGVTYYCPRGTFSTRMDAQAWLAAERRLVDLDAWTSPKVRHAVSEASGGEETQTVTLERYVAAWMQGRKLRDTTAKHYRSLLGTHILPALGDMAVVDIDPPAVNKFYAALKATPVRGGGTGATRNARVYALLHTILESAVDDELLARNPARIRGAASADRDTETVLPTLAELTTIAETMPDHLQALPLVAAWCGLRRGEVLGLRRDDVAADGSTVTIRRAMSFESGKAVAGKTKTKASLRTVSVPDHIQAVIVAHLEAHVGKGKTAYLFTTDGEPVDEWTLRFHWERARSAAGRQDLRLHDLRHAGATWAAQAGATTAELQARIGHSTAVAAMRYQRVEPGRDRQLAKRMAALAGE